MAQNLLLILPKMSLEMKYDIAFAVRNFGPTRALGYYSSFRVAAEGLNLGFLDKSLVRSALRAMPERYRGRDFKDLVKLLAKEK